MWIVTSSVNDYNQYGEYFEVAFESKPTVEELNKLGFDGKHLINGGGRKGVEDVWYYLYEVKSGVKLK